VDIRTFQQQLVKYVFLARFTEKFFKRRWRAIQESIKSYSPKNSSKDGGEPYRKASKVTESPESSPHFG